MSTLYAAIGFFSLAIILGLLLLSQVLSNKPTTKAVAFIHGPFAATGIILLIIYASKHGPGLMESIILFIIAALGGIVLIARDLMGKTVPKWLAIVHGLTASIGFIVLLGYAFM